MLKWAFLMEICPLFVIVVVVVVNFYIYTLSHFKNQWDNLNHANSAQKRGSSFLKWKDKMEVLFLVRDDDSDIYTQWRRAFWGNKNLFLQNHCHYIPHPKYTCTTDIGLPRCTHRHKARLDSTTSISFQEV